jgi:hypothetical protein
LLNGGLSSCRSFASSSSPDRRFTLLNHPERPPRSRPPPTPACCGPRQRGQQARRADMPFALPPFVDLATGPVQPH